MVPTRCIINLAHIGWMEKEHMQRREPRVEVSELFLFDLLELKHVGFFQSFMATSASTALSTLPITIGGSGLAELGIWAYITNISSIPNLTDVLNSSQLSVIIAWRIATYHIPLVIMWIALMRITIGKDSIANQIKSKNRDNR